MYVCMSMHAYIYRPMHVGVYVLPVCMYLPVLCVCLIVCRLCV